MLVRADSRDRYYKLMEETSDGGSRRQWETHGERESDRERERNEGRLLMLTSLLQGCIDFHWESIMKAFTWTCTAMVIKD